MWARDFMVLRTSLTISGSRAEVGSSRRRISGSIMRARTMATRCFCPPEREAGWAPRFSKRPICSRSFSALGISSLFVLPKTVLGA